LKSKELEKQSESKGRKNKLIDLERKIAEIKYKKDKLTGIEENINIFQTDADLSKGQKNIENTHNQIIETEERIEVLSCEGEGEGNTYAELKDDSVVSAYKEDTNIETTNKIKQEKRTLGLNPENLKRTEKEKIPPAFNDDIDEP